MKTLIKAVVPKRLRPAFRRPYTCVRRKLFVTKLFGHYTSLIPPLAETDSLRRAVWGRETQDLIFAFKSTGEHQNSK